MLNNGELTSEPQEIADRMAEYLMSTFTKKEENEENLDWDNVEVEGNREVFSTLTLTEDEVIKIIRSVKSSNGRDSLGVSINMLKNSIGITSGFVTNIINKSLDTSTVPKNLKRSFVRYIPKGQKSTTEMPNLRPINVSPVVVKLIERGGKNKIAPNLVENGFFEEHQYGFLKGRSTVHNLFYVTMKIQRAIKMGQSVIMMVTDFSKAFDKIPFSLLLKELHKAGIRGKLGRWFEAWTVDNVFKIKFGNFSSAWCDIISGLKQGSAAGPLAFIIAVNSLIQALPHGSSVMFADDQTIVVIVSKITRDVAVANDLLKKCHEWSKLTKLHYNVSKCQYIVLPIRPSLKPELYLGEEKITEKPFIESLGVLFSGRRKNMFEDQHDRIVRSVTVITNKILRKFRRSTFARKRHLLETYIRPKIDYCSPVWNTHRIGQPLPNYLVTLDGCYASVLSGTRLRQSDRKRGKTCPLFPSERVAINDLIYIHELNNGRTPHKIEDFLVTNEDRERRTGTQNPDLINHHECHSLLRRNGQHYSTLGAVYHQMSKKEFKMNIEKKFLKSEQGYAAERRKLINCNQYRKTVYSKRRLFLSTKTRLQRKQRQKKT